jgi:hypothetical protein
MGKSAEETVGLFKGLYGTSTTQGAKARSGLTRMVTENVVTDDDAKRRSSEDHGPKDFQPPRDPPT